MRVILDIGLVGWNGYISIYKHFERQYLLFMLYSVDEVIDTSGGCGAKFEIEIVSEQFEGKRLLARHRLVNAALEEEMKQIHALSIKKAMTPEQWKQQQESNAAA
ncbi:protein BOLA2 [Citrus sinensis]|uniref:Protein BOLA2 n=1 Tax=Citrus sinensis TaxID=2711 RepID=A0ACB8JM33_CITSI|nr:protein BOLA2 [Citrus sinensis]KAH9717881.1 protein BOLA2 [Citrus sinensis]